MCLLRHDETAIQDEEEEDIARRPDDHQVCALGARNMIPLLSKGVKCLGFSVRRLQTAP